MSFRVTHFNGIDGRTGFYASPWSNVDAPTVRECLRRYIRERARRVPRNQRSMISPSDLSECGWGIVYTEDLDPSILDALEPLILRRRAQAGTLFKACRVAGSVTAETFLASYGSGPNAECQPSVLPYYLLLVGGPSELPLSFQVELQTSHAVGRIQFDSPEDYAAYARTVVSVETEGISRRPSVCFFETRHPGDPVTKVTAEVLGRPLRQDTKEFFSRYGYSWNLRDISAQEATKRALTRLLEVEDSPTLLVFTGHTVTFPSDQIHRFEDQGAWLCSDWPYPLAGSGNIEQEWTFGPSDVRERAILKGMVGFSPSSFVAGRASRDRFELPWAPPSPSSVGSHIPHIAPLPVRLLCHPTGGALAFVGQIDRRVVTAAGDRYLSACLKEWVREVISGLPVGEALKRFQLMASDLGAEARRGVQAGGASQNERDWIRLACTIAAENVQTYIVLGDPAVRIPRYSVPPAVPCVELG